jgi:hypothetical protein
MAASDVAERALSVSGVARVIIHPSVVRDSHPERGLVATEPRRGDAMGCGTFDLCRILFDHAGAI